jgi:outer membrane protein TolC
LQEVYRVASARYSAGTIGRDQLLTSQASLLQQQQAALTAASNVLQAKISLIRALGGGYQAPAADNKA